MSYLYETLADLMHLSETHELPVWEIVIRAEMEATGESREAIEGEALRRVQIFKDSVVNGIEDRKRTLSGMSGGQAHILLEHTPRLLSPVAYKALTYAIAVNEANAKMFRVVACPTAGSCGVMPGCMCAVGEEFEMDDAAFLRGFFTGAGIGNVITNQACVAGAVGGCQAEVGSAAAMAAGAIVAMLEGNTKQVMNAVALCLKNVLGLVCDPVAGLVEVPCVKRNGVYAVHAFSAAEMAMAGLISQIPVDEVIDAMNRIGRALPSTLRETSEGGLATTETGRRIAAQLRDM
ncbi:L-serine ammonia-lyase, iron-sulfur-dependent, subunit alpha [Veillonella sp. R32]|uniref:L-serine ammonia-lyase, iron-sulfur-dependent, subunit alpha n=1 Tax=Veillonella sp. R32 TaxID=2021312 RepID=UPI00138A6769|nr:L-serine ammonia-lyase, iron-sulfur-dependent, subunit alpha [Veillonella sp. R32]KAF1683063.1 L-serine ammonia-lyase, iron-sulfur-dependent, subunit alpha [Veillonella sp. R32]